MKKSLIVVFALLLLAGCQSQKEQENKVSVPVRITVTQPDSISKYLKLTGGVEAMNDALVYSKTSEKVDKILVKIGEMVQANQALIVQSNQILGQGVKLAKASVENAKAQHQMVQQDYERIQRLFKSKAISQQQLDQTEAQFKAAEAGLEQAQAQLEQAKEQYQNSTVKAPFAGKVAMIMVENGQMVPAGQPVVKIVNASQMKAKLYVPATDMSFVHEGQKVIARFPAIPDTEFVGYIQRVDEAVDPVKRALEIEVRLVNDHPAIKSGMFGQFLVETQFHPNTIVLPDNAVLTQTEVKTNPKTGEQEAVKRYYAYIVKNGKAQLQEIKLGLYAEGRMEIISGLSVNDSVIVMGQNIVKDGNPVKIVNE